VQNDCFLLAHENEFFGRDRSGLVFPLFFLIWYGGAPGYFPRPPMTTHVHPLFSFLLSGRHNTNGRPIRPGFEPCRPRGGVGRVSLFLPPPYRHPLKDIHKHPRPGGGSFLGKNPPPSVRFGRTSAEIATSEHCLRQPCGHRATLFYEHYFFYNRILNFLNFLIFVKYSLDVKIFKYNYTDRHKKRLTLNFINTVESR
jgi:hypothetical protein